MTTMIGKRIHFGNMSADIDGTVVALCAAASNTFIVGSMTPAGRELTVVYDDLSISDLPESLINGVQHHWLDEPAKTPEECAELLARARKHQAETLKKRHSEANERQRIAIERQNWVAAKRPSWAKAVIIAEHMVDDSDSMTDYFASHTDRRLILAWSKHTRDLFPEMRHAARNAPETMHLADGGIEHREKYSMGSGYYLGDSRGKYSGWTISKERGTPAVAPEDYRIPEAHEKKTARVSELTIRPGKRDGYTEVVFPDKPPEETRQALKAAGYRWSRRNACWYGPTARLESVHL